MKANRNIKAKECLGDNFKQHLIQENDELIRNFENDKIKEASGHNLSNIKSLNYENGSKFKGEFRNNKRHGKGIYYYTNGDIYAGDWKNDEFFGNGFYIFASGERYRGEFKNGKKHGKGNYFYQNGCIYKGMWALDKKNGDGCYTYPNNGKRQFFSLNFRKVYRKLGKW